MKICVITSATWSIRKFRIDMIDEFIGRDCEVVVFGNEPEELWKDYFSEHAIKYRSFLVSRNGLSPLMDVKTLLELKRLMKEEKPDKVFTYQIKPNIYGGIAAHLSGVSDLFLMMGGIGSVFLSDSCKARVIKRVITSEYKIAMKYAKAVFFQNRDDAKEFIKRDIISKDKIVYVNGSGVNTVLFSQSPLPDTLSFIFVGRAIRDKGAWEYLCAARELKHRFPFVACHFVGDVDSNPSSLTKEEIEQFLLDGSVVWHGWQNDIRPFLAESSVFVLPSYREGTPKAALEAMAMGRAVITTDAPGCREVVVDGLNGFLVPPKNLSLLVDAMGKFALDKRLVKQMGDESRKIAVEKFDVDKVNSVICEVMGIGD